MRRRTFSEGVAILVAFWVLAEVMYGFLRDPIADTYTGEVFVVTNKDGRQLVTPLQAKLKLDVVDKGYIYDRRPGVFADGVRAEFTGGDLEILSRYGIAAPMINAEGASRPYADAFCEVKKVDARKNASFFAGLKSGYDGYQTDYAAAFHLTFLNMPGQMNCGTGHIGVIDFNTIQYAIDGTSQHGFIVATLTRDSHISFFQRMIMKMRFSRSDIKTTYGSAV